MPKNGAAAEAAEDGGACRVRRGQQRGTLKGSNKAPVPDGPPPQGVLLQKAPGVAPDESYGEDEKALNTFLKLHPMLSAEAASVKALSGVANLFQKAAIQVAELPTVSKTHDDLFLRPANTPIGERPCINDARCIARFLAQVRYGPESPKAFTCTEFLLPSVHKRFLEGRGLPPRCAPSASSTGTLQRFCTRRRAPTPRFGRCRHRG